MVLIYVHKATPRLQYIAQFIFKELIKVPYAITSHKESFKKFEEVKLNYTDEACGPGELKIPNNGLLGQQGTSQVIIDLFEYKKTKAFVKSVSKSPEE